MMYDFVREIICITRRADGQAHIAPMGVRDQGEHVVVAPFRPSATLENLLRDGRCVLNGTDDVRVYAGCLLGRRDWPLTPVDGGFRLRDALAHEVLELERIDEDALRPRLFCRVHAAATHRPFRGYNRAQAAVLELAILVSRLDRLAPEKIAAETAYLQIALDKTGGPREHEAWGWLIERIEAHQRGTGSAAGSAGG